MIHTAIGLLLLIPIAVLTGIGSRARNPNIPSHRKPGLAFMPNGLIILDTVWLVFAVASFGFLIAGSGWWSVILFFGGLCVIWIILGLLGLG